MSERIMADEHSVYDPSGVRRYGQLIIMTGVGHERNTSWQDMGDTGVLSPYFRVANAGFELGVLANGTSDDEPPEVLSRQSVTDLAATGGKQTGSAVKRLLEDASKEGFSYTPQHLTQYAPTAHSFTLTNHNAIEPFDVPAGTEIVRQYCLQVGGIRPDKSHVEAEMLVGETTLGATIIPEKGDLRAFGVHAKQNRFPYRQLNQRRENKLARQTDQMVKMINYLAGLTFKEG